MEKINTSKPHCVCFLSQVKSTKSRGCSAQSRTPSDSKILCFAPISDFSTFALKLVTEEEVLKIIESLNNSSSTVVDFIDTKTVKLVKNKIVGALTTIINLGKGAKKNPKCKLFPKGGGRGVVNPKVYILKKSIQ